MRRFVRWLQPAILVLAVVAIAWFLATQWSSLRSYPWQLHAGWLATAILLLLITWAVEVWMWQTGLRQLGGKLGFFTAWRIWFLSAIVRYVPGNVLQPLSMTLYARRHGVAPTATVISIMLYQVVAILGVLPIAVIYFGRIDTQSRSAQLLQQLPPWLLWLALLPALIFLLRPGWLLALLNVALVRMGRPSLSVRLNSLTLLGLLLVAVVDWLLWGATFAAFTFAVAGGGTPDKAALLPHLIAAFPIANVVAFLSVVVPSGLGVREGALYFLLSPYLDGAVVTVIAIAMRVFTTVGELLTALISFPFERPFMTMTNMTVTNMTVTNAPMADAPTVNVPTNPAPLPSSLPADLEVPVEPELRREPT